MLGMHCFEGLMGSKLIGQRARLVRASQRTERDDHVWQATVAVTLNLEQPDQFSP